MARTLPNLWARIRLNLEGHVLNPLWLPRDERRQRRFDAFGRVIAGYVKRYLPSGIAETPAVSGDEKIYSIWFQGEENAPELIRSCFATIRRHCPQELVVLDEKTIFDYITLPEEIVAKFRDGKMKYCHFADICRLELLHRYGGWWIDATCFLTGPVPEWISEQDFFMYMAGRKVHGNYSFVQNCFIRARKGDYLLEAWRAMILDYWMHEDCRIDHFQHQVMFKVLVENDPVAAAHFGRMTKMDQYPTHIIWYERPDQPYDAAVLDDITGQGLFFQKTTYRTTDAVVPGSFRDFIVNYCRSAR